MSRAYRISVAQSERRHIRVDDGVRTQLELLGVLPAEAMCGLLAAELGARGFTRDGEHMVRQDDDGVEIRVGVDGDRTGQVTVRLAREKAVDIRVERSKRTYDESAAADRVALNEQVAQAIDRRTKEETDELGAEVTEVLERKLRDLRREFDRIGNQVTAEALKVRAGQLGEIREISEDPETGSLTIKVRV